MPSNSTRIEGPPARSPDPGVLHDLAHLTDAALRCISAAQGTRAGEPARSLAALDAALTQIADLVAQLAGGRRLGPPLERATGVAESVCRAVELMRATAEEQGVAIDVEVDSRLGAARVSGLYRVVTEGITNALSSIGLAACTTCGRGGRIVVTATFEGEAVVVRIRDDGAGPPEAVVSGGGGVGIAVMRGIVERWGGTLSLARGAGGAPGRPGAVLEARWPSRRGEAQA